MNVSGRFAKPARAWGMAFVASPLRLAYASHFPRKRGQKDQGDGKVFYELTFCLTKQLRPFRFQAK